jgi:hypothetical protein
MQDKACGTEHGDTESGTAPYEVPCDAQTVTWSRFYQTCSALVSITNIHQLLAAEDSRY